MDTHPIRPPQRSPDPPEPGTPTGPSRGSAPTEGVTRGVQDLPTLVGAAAAGDEDAWKELVERFDRTVRGVAARHRLSETDREDVAQRTWLQLFLSIDRLREPAAVGGWLAITARRECLRVLQARAREVLVDEACPPEERTEESVEDHVVAVERRAALHGALARVPTRERVLIRLLIEEPALSYDQVSSVLRMPRGSLGPTRARCIARLRGDAHLAAVAGATR